MDITRLSAGKNPPEEITVFIEIPQGSSVKYEIDKESGVLMADRFLYTAMSYPFNYGFMPQTQSEDGDNLDILVISSHPVQSGCAIAAKPIGMLEMEDEEGMDEKILAVPTQKIDPVYGKITDISDLDEATKNKIKHFFDHYKELEPNKWVKTKEFLPKAKALAAIKKSMK